MSSREQFEQSIKAFFGDSVDYRICENSDGEYMAWDMQVAWWAWQAASKASEQQLAAVVAENAGLNDKMNTLATWPGIEFYSSAWEFCNLDGNDALDFMCDVKTPATDAYLAEVRAQGLEMLCEAAEQLMNEFSDDSYKVMVTGDLQRLASAFAAQLRQGAAI